METLTYLQVDEANSEKELTLEALKMSGKLAGVVLSAAGAAIAVGTAQAPAQAYGYGGGHGSGCYDFCEPTFVGGGYQVTSYKTYDVSYDVSHDKGCYDYCNTSWGGGGHGCYDYCGVSYGGGYGGGYGGCYDPCGVATPYGGYGGGYSGISYGGGCYDYCGVSYGGGYDNGCYDYCGVSYGGYSTYDIQSALSYAGFHVSVDGVYGPETHYAVVAFQQAVGLVPDGIVGPATASALGLY